MSHPLTRHDRAALFKALADETRLRILHALFEREQCVTELMQRLGLAQSHVSHHLKVLKTVGLIGDRRDGQKICYALRPDVAVQLSETRQETLNLGCCEVRFRA